MKMVMVSDRTIPSLIHIPGYSAVMAAAMRPAVFPANLRASSPITTIVAVPRTDDASRCAVTPSRPMSDHSARYDVYIGGWPALGRWRPSKNQGPGSTNHAPFASAFACQW